MVKNNQQKERIPTRDVGKKAMWRTFCCTGYRALEARQGRLCPSEDRTRQYMMGTGKAFLSYEILITDLFVYFYLPWSIVAYQ